MKIFTIILSLLLLSYINTGECDDKGSAEKASDCNDLQVSAGKKYCCYAKVENKDGSFGFCEELTKDEYDKIKDYIKKREEEAKEFNLKMKKLDCHSFYLTGSLLSLILILL